jgi:hypothetical protein
VRTLSVLALVVTAFSAAAANTFVGPPIPSCSSSANLVITVTELAKSASGVRVDVYREIEHGERVYWTGLTGSDGTARLPELLSGTI